MASTDKPLLPSRPGWPIEDVYVYLHHPANDRPFLRLYRSDVSPSSSDSNKPVYGIHHETLITAATILACSEPGYLSTSLDPNSRVDDPPDTVLLGRVYYFYLLTPHPQHPSYLYPLCRNFKYWRFSHGALPHSWSHKLPRTEDIERSGEDEISGYVKDRDKVCLVSGWKDGLSVAHLVPEDHNLWLQENQMRAYLSDPIEPYHLDPRNLFTLRGDLHSLFSQGYFAFLPKYSTGKGKGDLRVHFLRKSRDAGMAFHDVDANIAALSTELMYARFAWALMTIMDEVLEVNLFRFVGEQPVGRRSVGGNDGHDKRGRKSAGDKKPKTQKPKAPGTLSPYLSFHALHVENEVASDCDRGENERDGGR